MKNTTTRRIVLTLYTVCFCLVTQAQATLTDFQQDLKQAFTNGNALLITKSIGETAYIATDDDMQDQYSKPQAEYVLKSFFRYNSSDSRSFVINNIGQTSDGVYVLFCEYVLDYNRTFEVEAYVKLLDDEYRLLELTIEEL